MTRLAKAICIIALLGIITSGYATYLHYQTTDKSFCNFSEKFNCDVVNKSLYAEILGVPVALLGIVGYIVIMLGSLFAHRDKRIPGLVAAACTIGLLFSLYLTAIEFFVLATFCVVCLTSQLIILACTILAFSDLRKPSQQIL